MKNQTSSLLIGSNGNTLELCNKPSTSIKNQTNTKRVKIFFKIESFKKNYIGFKKDKKIHKSSTFIFLFYPSILLFLNKIIKKLTNFHIKKLSDFKYKIKVILKINILFNELNEVSINKFLNKKLSKFFKKLYTLETFNNRFYNVYIGIKNLNF